MIGNLFLGKRVGLESIIDFLFFCLAVIVLCNINGIITAFAGIEAPISPLMLLLSIVLLAFIPIRQSYLKGHFMYFLIFFASFLFFGLIGGAFNTVANFGLSDIIFEVRMVVTALIISGVFYFYTLYKAEKGKIHKAIGLVCFLYIITTMGTVLEAQLGLQQVNRFVGERNMGFFGNPNQTGFQANITCVLILYLFLSHKLNAWLALPLFGLGMYAAFLSFSKMAILNSGLILFLFFLYINFFLLKFERRTQIKSLVLMLTVVGTVVFIIIPAAQTTYNNMSSAQQKRIEQLALLVTRQEFNTETTSHRSDLFADAIERIEASPLVGYGLHTFSEGGLFASSITHGAHNNYFKIIGESGFIPLLLYLLFVGRIFIQMTKKKYIPHNFMVGAVFVIISTSSITTHSMFTYKFVIALMGVLMAIPRVYRLQQTKQSHQTIIQPN